MQTESLRTTTLHSVAEATPYLDAWRRLSSRAPMRSPEWLLSWWQHYATPDDYLHVILVLDCAKNLVGLAPLYQHSTGLKRSLQILGARNNCSHHNNWLSLAGYENHVGEAIGHYLLQHRQDWNRLLLEAADADATAVRTTLNHLDRHGCLVHQRPINSGWKINLPDSWDDYLQRLSRSLRKRCRKLQRQFFDSGTIRICQVDCEEHLEQGFQILLKLHATRWGDHSAPLGVFSDNRFRAFHEKMAQSLLSSGQLRLAWLECNNRPIAVEYQFFDDRTVYAYQAGLDLSAHECSPGKLSMMAAIRFAIERGCSSFDLLGGDEPYKLHWRAVPTPRHDLRAWQRGLTGYTEWTLWHIYMMCSMILKKILPERLSYRLAKLSVGIKKVCQPTPRTDA